MTDVAYLNPPTRSFAALSDFFVETSGSYKNSHLEIQTDTCSRRYPQLSMKPHLRHCGQSVALFTFHNGLKGKHSVEGQREPEEDVGRAWELEGKNKALHCLPVHFLFTSPLEIM